MKTITLYITLILFSLQAVSCNSMFDNETPPHSLSGENAITDQASAETALNGIYGYLHGFGAMSANYIADNEFRSGMLKGRYRGSFDDTENAEFKVPYESTYLTSPWEQAYTLINTANNFIYYTEKVSDGAFQNGRKEEMIAEAKFMRAFGHIYLLRRFGYFWDINSRLGVIIRKEPSSLSNNSKGRSTVAECYNAIFEDLDYAIAKGPTYYSKFRSCSTTAKAFKADILMNRGAEGDYAEAIRLANEVIASKEFGMENSFADVFKNGYNSKELLFTRFIKEPPLTIDYNTSTIFKMFCGNGTYKPTNEYLEIMTKEDARYEHTFQDWEFTDSKGEKYTEIIWKKHYVSNGDCPMWYMRVAQMYLIKAEAMVRTKASTKDVVDVLNILRTRSGNKLLNAADYGSEQTIMDEVYNENVKEIGMENGALYLLCIRMKNNNGDRKLKSYNTYYTNDDQLCYPIPKSECDYNTKIEQKPL